jgi:Na+-driven multidrug efflux pump
VVRNFGAVFCYAVAGAAGIYIGKSIGAGKMEEAKQDSKRAMVLMFVTGLIGGFLILAVIPLVMQIADLSATAMRYLKIITLI